MPLAPNDLIVILKHALFAFRGKMGVDVSALRIETLALAAVEPGIEQKETGRPLGVSASAAGRNIVNLGKRMKDGTPGPDFVEQRPVRLPGRGAARKAIYPTAKGLNWLDRLAREVNAATGRGFDALRLAWVLRVSMSRIRAATDTDIAVYRVLTLLCVLEQPGMFQADIGTCGQMDSAAVSRSVRNLSVLNEKQQPGPDFIEQRLDPQRRKEHRVYPTVKAQHWLETVVNQVNARLSLLGSVP